MTLPTLTRRATIFLLLLASLAEAQNRCEAPDQECVAVGQWSFALGIGLGGRTNPVVDNDNLPILLLPEISYYGERFFWETDTIGVTLLESPKQMVNIIATVSYDQNFFNDWGVGNFSIGGDGGTTASISSNAQLRDEQQEPPLADDVIGNPEFSEGAGNVGPLAQAPPPAIDLDDLHDRDIAGLAGIEYTLDLPSFSVGIQALQDVSGVHDGGEVRLAVSKYFSLAKHQSAVTAGAEWRDSQTLDYYYGVRVDEVENPRDAYLVDSDVSYYVKLDWRYRLSGKWHLRAVLHHRWFGDEVKDSPLVDEDGTTAAFVGGVYNF